MARGAPKCCGPMRNGSSRRDSAGCALADDKLRLQYSDPFNRVPGASQ